MALIVSELFEKTLIQPLEQGANRLYIVSGYATAIMAIRHIEFAKRLNKDISIRLVYGMSPQDGIEKTNHIAFQNLQLNKIDADFQCDYIINRPPVHSKVYAWFNNETPISGFIGSANYTRNAFSSSMREVLLSESPIVCKEYYQSLIGETVNCLDENIAELVEIFERTYDRMELVTDEELVAEASTAIPNNIINLPAIRLPLTDRYGEVPNRSGLNWGQRPGREPNQAYIGIPADIGRSGFFPDRFEPFTVITDDEKQMICVRAQDNGKGLHTTLNNSLLGEYFRYRLGLANGQFVTKDDLLRYGRSDVTFYKIDEETYFLDFSVR